MRNAPAQMVSTASLTVAPGTVVLMAFTSASGMVMASKTRCGETRALNRVVGTLRLGSWISPAADPARDADRFG